MSNPLTLLSKLRRFGKGNNVEDYLNTEMRQNFKAIEDAFRKQGEQVSSINSNSAAYCLYATKTTNLIAFTVSNEVTITQWDDPIQELNGNGEFNKTTGLWTCKRKGIYSFAGRVGLAANSGEEMTVRWYVNNVCKSTANNLSIARRGPTAVFTYQLEVDDVVKLTGETVGNTSMDFTAEAPVFFNVTRIASL